MSWRAQISRHVREFRFVCCDTSQSSLGLRTFFKENYPELKMLNPTTPFLYREGNEMRPFIYARFDWEEERKIYVENKSDTEILNIVESLVKEGMTLPKSPESDIVVAQPIIDSEKGEDYYDVLNLTWDGVTVRRNPSFQATVEEATKD